MYLLSMIIINIFAYDYHTYDLHKMNENFFSFGRAFWKILPFWGCLKTTL